MNIDRAKTIIAQAAEAVQRGDADAAAKTATALAALDRLLQEILSTPAATRNPAVLIDVLRDCQMRVEQLERLRAPVEQSVQPRSHFGGRVSNQEPWRSQPKERYTHEPS